MHHIRVRLLRAGGLVKAFATLEGAGPPADHPHHTTLHLRPPHARRSGAVCARDQPCTSVDGSGLAKTRRLIAPHRRASLILTASTEACTTSEGYTAAQRAR